MCVCVLFPRGERCTARRSAARHPAQCHGAMLRCAVLALLCAALAHADNEKRAEMSPVPFVMGSRYGRSPERVMAPRNDRFFMGSRYGKRSEALPAAQEATCAEAPCRALLCRYTGVMALFKCVRPHEQLQFARRSTDDIGPGEQQ